MSFRKSIRTFLRYAHEAVGSPKYSRPALNDIDVKLQRYLDFKNGYFIEAGANDGYTQSNTYYLEKFLGWRGVLVEGIPELYQKCKRVRKKSHVQNCALVSKVFSESFVEMHYANLMSVTQNAFGDESIMSDHLKRGLKIQNIGGTYSVKVPARTLDTVLAGCNDLPRIDFMSLDVEGYEMDVLKGMSFDKYQPRYMLIETRDFDAVAALLSPYYEFIESFSHHDYFFKSKQ